MDDDEASRWKILVKGIVEKHECFDFMRDDHIAHIHKVRRKGDQGTDYEPLMLLSDGKPTAHQVGTLSQVLMRIDRDYHCGRLYIDRSGMSDREFRKFRTKCENEARKQGVL